MHRHLTPILLLASLVTANGGPAAAIEKPAPPIRAEIERTLRLDPPIAACGQPCTLVATIDRDRLFASLPLLQRQGVLSGAITGADLKAHPTYFANALALLATAWTLEDAYAADPSLGATHWRVRMAQSADEPAGERPLFEFDFDRTVYRATDWAPQTFVALPRLAPNFRTNLRLVLDMSREMGGGINED